MVDALPKGLSAAEVEHKRGTFGRNEIAQAAAVPAWRLFAAQFQSALVLLLVVAAVVAASVGEGVDAVAICAIIVINGVIGFWQEYRAQNAVLALRATTAPRARVARDGRAAVIPAVDVVPGDILLLEAGDVVAADARLLQAHALTANEAVLTGESLPAEKRIQPTSAEAPLAERHDHVFLGTHVAAGSGVAEVVATGMQTELGRIATLLEAAVDEETPLQRDLRRLGHALLAVCLALVAVIVGVRLAQGDALLEVFLLAVPLAVAAVPEGLPAVVTIALAVGVQRMAARNVLVRRLAAVETLGAATLICTDKTGTLTTGEMTVRAVWGDAAAVLGAAAACCDADLQPNGKGVGDPTELAILRAAAEHGIRRDAIEVENPRDVVNPFDAERKRMSILRADGRLYVKGAVDHVLPLSASAPGALEANADFAGRGLRVLAVAIGRGAQEVDLELVGLVAMADPPRPEAVAAIAEARAAGVRTVMITGDHPATARAIAREMGIVADGEDATTLVHARATPADKLRIVREAKARGEIVAMTGDGVNDAPALREAHIGVAMGVTGTEVTREAADMVLADDNFASIVAAVREGRGIWDNIRKTLVYLLGGNAGELLTVLGATLVGLPAPFAPVQILWINLVTDGLPALALVVDPPAQDTLSRPPRRANEPMIGAAQWRRVLVYGVLDAVVVIAVYAWALRRGPEEAAHDLAFSALVFAELFRAFAARSATLTFWEVGATSNLRLLAVVLGSIALQLVLPHLPGLSTVLDLAPLSPTDTAMALAAGLVPVTVLEGWKIAGKIVALLRMRASLA